MDEREHAAPPENKTGTFGTISHSHAFVTGDAKSINLAVSRPKACGYVVVPRWRYGDASPFCDAPAVPGSSYCARHKALCVVAPTSAAAARITAAQARAGTHATAPPPELADLAAVELPEAPCEDAGNSLVAFGPQPREAFGS